MADYVLVHGGQRDGSPWGKVGSPAPRTRSQCLCALLVQAREMESAQYGVCEEALIGNTENEQKLYGEAWNKAFNGYFSDPRIAAPLVRAVVDVVEASSPMVITDLGGGTGFLLSEIAGSMNPGNAARLVCVDEAAVQLDDCPDGIDTLDCTVENIERSQLTRDGERLLLCMRSVLHYFGESGLRPLLAHLRSLLEHGECFIHQTICIEDERDRETANLLYLRMDTGKWYPSVVGLTEALEQEGFRVVSTVPAMPLVLTQAELEERYGVGHDRMKEIRRELQGLPRSSALVEQEDGFSIRLDYTVMSCTATASLP